MISNTALEIYTPDPEAVQQFYKHHKQAAYWAQVWPASIGLCLFLKAHPEYIAGKNVLELAAGLGLPGLYIAPLAKQVIITDKEPRASGYVLRSAGHLQLNNIEAKTLNWQDAVSETLPDILLLSDVSYEPSIFEALKKVLKYFLNNKVPVIISTPQRLVARPFINDLLPYSTQQRNYTVGLNNKETDVSIYVLE